MPLLYRVCFIFLLLRALVDGDDEPKIRKGNLLGGLRITKRNGTQYKSFEPIAVQIMKKARRELYPLVEDLIFDNEIPQECSSAFQKIMLGLQNFEFWAISFVRSSGGLPSMLEGNAVDLGNYDACIGAVAKNSQGEVAFTGRYCSLLLNVDNPLYDKVLASVAKDRPDILDLFYGKYEEFLEFSKNQYMRIGVCIPSTCHGENIEYAITKLVGEYGVEPWVLGCRAQSEDPPLTKFQRIVIGVLILLVGLCLLGSYFNAALDDQSILNDETSYGVGEILRCFSIQRSWDSVFNFTVKRNEKYLACLHGIRALSAVYLLWFHVYCIVDPTTIQNAMTAARWVRYDVSFVPVYMGANVVETFFCISGALTFRSFYREFQRGKKSVFAMAYSDIVRRYIRLAVPSVALIGLYTMMFSIVSGPTKDFAAPYFWGKCAESWWTVPTMLVNIMKAEDACLLHLWYVGVDFQLRIIFLIPIIAVASKTKYSALGVSLAGLLSMASVVYVSMVTYLNESIPVGIPTTRFIGMLLEMYYYVQALPVAHFASFAVGVFVMYLIEEQRSGRMKKLPKWIIVPCSIGIVLAGLANFFIPYMWQLGYPAWNAESALYAGLSRGMWSVGVGWIIYVCALGHGGPMNWLLTLRGLVPISRLSFSFYLIHIFVVETKVLQQRGYHEARHYLLTVTALGSVLVTLFCAFVFYCLVENPTSNFIDLFFEKPRRPPFPDSEAGNDKKILHEIKLKHSDVPVEKCYL